LPWSSFQPNENQAVKPPTQSSRRDHVNHPREHPLPPDENQAVKPSTQSSRRDHVNHPREHPLPPDENQAVKPPTQSSRRDHVNPREHPLPPDENQAVKPPTQSSRRDHVNPREHPFPWSSFQPDENQAVKPPTQSSRRDHVNHPREHPLPPDENQAVKPPTQSSRRDHVNPREHPFPWSSFQPDENQAVKPPTQSSRRDHVNPREHPLPLSSFHPEENQAVKPPTQSSRRDPAPWILASRKPHPHMPQKPLDAEFLLRMAGLRRQFDGASLRSTNSSLQILGSFVSLSSTVPSDSFSVLSLLPEDEFPPTPVFRDEIPKQLMTKVKSSALAAQTLRGSFASLNSSSAHRPPNPRPLNPRPPIFRPPNPTGLVRRGYWNRRGDHLTLDGYVVIPPLSMQYPGELKMYPIENEGYEDHDGVFIAYARLPELPGSLPKYGNPPERPYESVCFFFLMESVKQRLLILEHPHFSL
jgi:hypothetical protein